MGTLVCVLVRLSELVDEGEMVAPGEKLPEPVTEREREGDTVPELLAARVAEAAEEAVLAALMVTLGVRGNTEGEMEALGDTEAERLSDAAALSVAKERDADRVEERESEGAGERVREGDCVREPLLVPERAGERLELAVVVEEPVGKKFTVSVGTTTVLNVEPGM